MTEMLTTETCSECDGTGRVVVRRFFRKRSATERLGKWHVAQRHALGGWWSCGCTVTSQPALGGSTEWAVDLAADVEVCHYMRDAPHLRDMWGTP